MVKEKVLIPQALNDIPLSKYLEWANISEDASEFFKQARTLQIFCDIDVAKQKQMKAADRALLINRLVAMLTEKQEFTRTFTLNNIEYGFVPNMDDMSFGTFVDIDSIKDYKTELPKLMSILYRPITNKHKNLYQIEPYDSDSLADLRGMPAGIAVGALVFFWTIGRDCLTAIQNFTQEALAQMEHSRTSRKSGDGTCQSLASAITTLDELMRLLTSTSISAYYGFPTKVMWQPLTDKT